MRAQRRPDPARRGLGAIALLLSALGATPPAWGQTVMTVGGSGADLGTLRKVAEIFTAARPGLVVDVLPSIGSGGGIKAVLSGAVDLGLSARPLEAAERAAGAREILYARTPLVLAVQAGAPYEGITIAELVAIHAGLRTHWPDGQVIRPVLRPRTDTDTDVLVRSLPGLADALERAYGRRGLPVATTDQDAANLIASVPGGLGPVSLAAILAEQRPLKALALDGIRPSPATIADGTYPLQKPLYFVLGPAPKEEVLELIAFVRSDPGAAILAATGHLVVPPAAASR